MSREAPHVLAETTMTVKLQRCGAVDSRTVVSATIHDFLMSIVPLRLFLTLDARWLSNMYLSIRSSRSHGTGTSARVPMQSKHLRISCKMSTLIKAMRT